jgi:hypothetical protein
MFVECVNTVLRPPYVTNLVFQFLFDSSCKCTAAAHVFVMRQILNVTDIGGGAKLLWICVEILTDVGL